MIGAVDFALKHGVYGGDQYQLVAITFLNLYSFYYPLNNTRSGIDICGILYAETKPQTISVIPCSNQRGSCPLLFTYVTFVGN